MTSPKVKRRSRRWLWITLGILVPVLLCGGIAFAVQSAAPAPTLTGWTTEPVTTGTIDASISATGAVEPRARADLRFAADGTVIEVLVQPGEQVQAGAPLARLDTIDAELALARAEADLTQAQIALTDLDDGPDANAVREAEARLMQAQARYTQTTAQVSPADLTAARARVEQARTRLATLKAGPRSEDIREAEAQLARAQTALETQRDSLSSNKTGADLEIERSTTDLTRAQSSYSTARQAWEYVRETGRDPASPETVDQTGRRVPNTVNDAQRQQYYDQFVSAEAALRGAEVAVERAKLAYDSARQGEVTGVRDAEQALKSAQAGYDRVVAATGNDLLAEARAALASAQAELGRLTGTDRNSNVAVAQADIDLAQIALERLREPASNLERTRAEADVARAEIAQKQAQRQITQATLVAPFGGTITGVELRVGERPGATALVGLVDTTGYTIRASVDELDVAQVKIGQPVVVIIDALGGRELAGEVRALTPQADRNERGANTYAVTIALTANDATVLPGMTATVQIVTERKANVLLVPRRAIRTEGGKTYVLIPAVAGAATAQPAAPGGATAEPGERREVTIGLSNGRLVEVLSGLTAGEQVYVSDVVQTFNPDFGGG